MRLTLDPVRLPPPTFDEQNGAPVTVRDAAGNPVATLSATEWRALHVETTCVHGHRMCHACRYRLPRARTAPAAAPVAAA